MARRAQPVVQVDDATVSRLAREIARDIRPLSEILKLYQLTEDQFDIIADSKFFQTRLSEEVQLWSASDALTVQKRIEAKAATMVEDCLLEAYTLIHDRNQPMAAKVEMLKWAARMAGLGEAKASQGGESVKITINVGGKALEFEKEKLPRDVTKTTDVVELTPSSAA